MALEAHCHIEHAICLNSHLIKLSLYELRKLCFIIVLLFRFYIANAYVYIQEHLQHGRIPEITIPYPAPAISSDANSGVQEREQTTDSDPDSLLRSNMNRTMNKQKRTQALAGTLPDNASVLSTQARGLLMRLLDHDPKVRMRNIRQLQQSAFYMGFNFERVKTKKISPRSVLARNFPKGPPLQSKPDINDTKEFEDFDDTCM